jgi:hypothetical protein
MTPDSSGSRSASSTRRSHSGSSSRKSTPRCASEISPGRGSLPPPVKATALAVWCGARNGRTPHASAEKRAASEAITAEASASSSESGGRMPGRRCASIDLPVPGGPIRSSECAPAAAIASARFAFGCPRTSARSGTPGVSSRGADVGRSGGIGSRPARCAHTASSVGAGCTMASRTSAASGALAAGSTNARPARRAESAIGSAPRIGRSAPPSASSPANSYAGSSFAGIWPVAARIPSAIGRSKRPDSLRRSAGARLTVILRAGKSNCAFWSAARTRSRASFTSVSGSPTRLNAGSPPPKCTSTDTGGASRPARPRERTTARDIRLERTSLWNRSAHSSSPRPAAHFSFRPIDDASGAPTRRRHAREAAPRLARENETPRRGGAFARPRSPNACVATAQCRRARCRGGPAWRAPGRVLRSRPRCRSP